MEINVLLKLVLTTTLAFTLACEKKNKEEVASKITILPLLLPAVKEAMPAPTAVTAMNKGKKGIDLFAVTTPLEALSEFFTKSFSGISGVTGTGFVGTSIADLDSRISTLNTQFEDEPSCFKTTAYDWTITPGAPVSMGTPASYSLTLKLNCLSMFTQTNGDQTGAGSGMAWGRDDTNYYIALLLVQSNLTDKFGYFAIYNRATKAVDLLFMESSSSNNRYTVYRLMTDPATTKFEVAIAGSNFSEGPMFPALGCNTRIVSNGTEMLVAGKAGTTDANGVCQTDINWVFNSNNCYNPSNLNTAPAACSTLTTSSFSNGMTEFDGTQVYIARTNITSNLTLSGLEGNVAPAQ